MSTTRVSFGSVAQLSLYQLEQAQSRLQDLQSQLTTGQAINKPSDNPGAAVQALSYQSEMARSKQYSTNVTDGLGWLGRADSILSDVQTQLQRASSLAVEGANASVDQAGRNAIATEIDGIRTGLLSDANTSYLNRPLFGGTSAATAYNTTTGAYQGDNNTVSRTVAPATTVQINVTGPSVFGADTVPGPGGTTIPNPNNVFNVLSQLSTDLKAGNIAGINTDQTALSSAISNVSDSQAVVGARYNQLQAAQTQLTTQQSSLQTTLASLVNVDFAKAATDFTLQNNVYQAALKATSMVMQQSLVNFIQ